LIIIILLCAHCARCCWYSYLTFPVAPLPPCLCTSPAARSVRQAQRQAQLEGLLTEVISFVNEKRSHIPPVVSSSPCSFPWDISICGGSRLSFGLGTVKRMLMHSSPPAVLG
jgi:hypothetical protein